ncbi:SNAP-25 (synaptosome-associated protein) component of SNARE complex [Handroanthus impetiginosus]|uniref:SNAP-25 (Synaptosome-associated protein) component of SNARE complex n=1 Tax=Handroanthus impetiginosus TaxID=429701 RepID=A0A2G9H1Q3_9LAMI|nr:SNAP-25 (synaptosome-associated protein) component of SNARE complex [Handroanthus impetiginosus]
MFGFRKSPAEKPPRQKSVDTTNPFDSDDESDSKKNTITPARRTSSEPTLAMPDDSDDYFGRGSSSASSYKNKKDFDNMSVQELESYAVNQAEETTKSGEKLLNNLGGMFSMPWKPKKTKNITGPKVSKDDNDTGKRSTPEQREKLGLATGAKARGTRTPPPEPTNALQKIEVEKAKQDDALSDLSDILGELKGMAVDMGSELNKQNKALDDLHDDVEELNYRVKGANQRARKLIGK